MAEIRAVTFDYWNTLMVHDTAASRKTRGRLIGEALTAAGSPVELAVISAGFDVVRERFDADWRAGKQFALPEAIRLLLTTIGADRSPAAHAAVQDAWLVAGKGSDLAPVESDLGGTLEQLSSSGIGLGIICDVGLIPSTVLVGHLERFDLLQYFDHWSFSDVVGCYKPDAAIFAHSHQGLGIDDPAEVLHIGDLRRTDVAGAVGFGCVAAQYTGIVNDAELILGSPDPHYVVESHATLPEILTKHHR